MSHHLLLATNPIQWWCAAQGNAWTWTPHAYIGVWVLVLAMGMGYGRAVKGLPFSQTIAGWVGMLCLWIALDWPIGPLGAGYLLLAHSAQFLLVTMIAAPLLLFSLRHRLNSGHDIPPFLMGSLVRTVTTPLLAAIIFNLVAIISHAPIVVDALMVSQAGAFAIDFAWLLAGLIFWWPTLIRLPGHAVVRMPVTMLYLFMGTLFHSGIAVAMLASHFPLYRIYELAPPMSGLSALDDQQLAGGLMEVGGTGLIIFVVTILFFRWASERAEQTS